MAPPSTRAAHRRTAPTTNTAESTPPPSPAQTAADRAAAARWAANLDQDPNAVIVDTETTSKAERGRVVEVAAGDHTAAGDCRAVLRALAAMAQTAEAPDESAPAPHAHTPTHSVRVRLDGPHADVEALTRALTEGRAQVEHLDAPAPGRRGGYLAYGRLATRPEAPRA